MDKKRRSELKQLKYRKRINRWVAGLHLYICRDGSEIRNPKAVDVINDHGQLVYKTTSTPCSCYGCSGYYKYRRHEKKVQDRKLIAEASTACVDPSMEEGK